MKAAEDTAGKKEERDRAAAEKRARVKKLAEEKLEQKRRSLEPPLRRAEGLGRRDSKAPREGVGAGRVRLRVVERVERVEDVARQRRSRSLACAIRSRRAPRRRTSSSRRKPRWRRSGSCKGCRRAPWLDSTRKQLEEETRRKAERKRWVAAQKFEHELLSAHASEASEVSASKKKGAKTNRRSRRRWRG